MLIQDLITLGKMLYKERQSIGKHFSFSTSKANSISSRANTSTYYFPVAASDNLTTEEKVMIIRANERAYAQFVWTAFTLIPAVEVDSFDESTISDYLSKFHSNMGLRHDFTFDYKLECADFNPKIINEATSVTYKGQASSVADDKNVNVSNSMTFGNIKPDPESKPIKGGGFQGFIDSDWKKANDLLPSTIIVPVRFISKDTNQAHTVNVLVNIKADMHNIPSNILVNDISSSMTGSKKLLQFVKLISGEEDSLADFLFGISQMKTDIGGNKSPWLDAFKRRRRVADIAFGVLKNNFMPTGTICLTMNEVNTLKMKYNIDIFKEAERIMKEYYLLGFLIADQTNEILYTRYDSHTDFQEYPYKTLEREAASQDRVIKDMIKSMGSMR